MPSSLGRLEIVEVAVKQAGRSAELYAHSKLLLNNLLRNRALSKKYRVLKKIGTTITLVQGADTVDLPTDFGAAFESILPLDGSQPIIELESADFTERGGFHRSGSTTGCPIFCMVDREAGKVRFNCVANKNFDLQPIYYKLPAPYTLDSTDDNTKVWYEDDEALIEGLIARIYQYTDDPREGGQVTKFEAWDGQYRAGTTPIQAGSSRIRLAKSTFRTRGHRSWR